MARKIALRRKSNIGFKERVGLIVRVFEAEYGSPEHNAAITLRLDVLRKPLGLGFSTELLDAERYDIHLVALYGREVVGCLLLTALSESQMKMRQVAVTPMLQRRGIGARLCAVAEKIAADRGFGEIVLHSRESAVPFYLRLGYKIVGEPFEQVTLPHREMVKRLLTPPADSVEVGLDIERDSG